MANVIKLEQFIDEMERIAPPRYAEAWDNVGLIVGDPKQSISRGMLTIDYTPGVAKEAAESECDLIVAYHPPLFHAIKRLTADSPESLIFDAIRRGLAIYSPHTAWDVADGGANDVLADAIGIEDRKPLRMAPAKASQYKLVTFVPKDAVEKVSQAVFDAGAGRIGNYSSCSFRIPGTGTFFGEKGTNPAIGASGRLETVDEIRVETVVLINRVEAVLKALRESHPYEEPAFDLNQLAAVPEGVGQGRIGSLKARSRPSVIERIKKELKLSHLLIAGPMDGEVTSAACCAGAGSEFVADAIAQKAGLYVTGEIRHHDAIKAANAGMTVVCTLHSNSERGSLTRLKDRLAEKLLGLELLISSDDRDPFTIA